MSSKNVARTRGLRRRRMAACCLGLGLGLFFLGLSLSGIARASGPENGLPQGGGSVIGLASNALTCLAVGDDLPGDASGSVRLAWKGQAEGARLVLNVAGAEAAHTIKVNGQPAALTPVHPGGQPCSAGEYFYLDISPELLVQGENSIEITDDALPGDSWTAANVRLHVLGDVTVLSPVGVVGPAAFTYIIEFVNSYDGSTQEAMLQVPGNYSPGTPVPLLVAVHPRSGTMDWGADTFGLAADDRDWLLISPQLHGSWPIPEDCYDQPPGPNCQYEDEVLLTKPGAYAYASLESQYDAVGAADYVVNGYDVRADQIYLAGYSMGGQGGVVTGAKFPHIFAAVFDNKGPTDMATWYDEQVTYYGTPNQPQVRAMRKECHIVGDPKTPVENPFCYQRRSGLRFASNYLHIPISVTHSISDAMVPIHHSWDLRDAINGYGPDRMALLYEDPDAVDPDTGLPCGDHYHCYEPEAEAVLDFLAPFTLDNNPTHINITTDESKVYYWMNLVQTGGDHWSQVEVTYYPVSTTVTAFISDTQPLMVALNLGSTPTMDVIEQPGMGLPATTYLVRGGGDNFLHNYASGYLTTTLTATGQFALTISAVEMQLSADPSMVSGWQTEAVTIAALVRDGLDNPVPDGTTVEFSTTAGTFPNGDPVYTRPTSGGQAMATLTLAAVPAEQAEIEATVEGITAATAVVVIHPALDLTVTPNETAVYVGDTVTYTYQFTNTGDTTLTAVTVVDDNGTPGTSDDDMTVCTGIALARGEPASCSRSTTATRTTTNTATVTGQDSLGNEVSATDWATVDATYHYVYLPFVIRDH